MKRIFWLLSVFFLWIHSFVQAQWTPSLDLTIDKIANQLVVKIQSEGPSYQAAVSTTLAKLKVKYAWNEQFLYIINQIDSLITLKLDVTTAKAHFKVKVENISYWSPFESPFTPVVYAIHNDWQKPIFTVGEEASPELELLAEDWKATKLYEKLKSDSSIKKVWLVSRPVWETQDGELFASDSYEFEFDWAYWDRLNLVTMIAQTNDLIVSADWRWIELFDGEWNAINWDMSYNFMIWDAGTEINQEPGKWSNQAPRQWGSNIWPDENWVVDQVNDGFEYPNAWEMLRVTVEAK